MQPLSVEGPTRPHLNLAVLHHQQLLLLVNNVLASFPLFFLSSLCPPIPASVSKQYFNNAVLIHDCSLIVLSIPTPQVHKIFLDQSWDIAHTSWLQSGIISENTPIFFFCQKGFQKRNFVNIKCFLSLPTESVLRRCLELRLNILEMFKRIFKKKKLITDIKDNTCRFKCLEMEMVSLPKYHIESQMFQ